MSDRAGIMWTPLEMTDRASSPWRILSDGPVVWRSSLSHLLTKPTAAEVAELKKSFCIGVTLEVQSADLPEDLLSTTGEGQTADSAAFILPLWASPGPSGPMEPPRLSVVRLRSP